MAEAFSTAEAPLTSEVRKYVYVYVHIHGLPASGSSVHTCTHVLASQAHALAHSLHTPAKPWESKI